MHLLLLTALLAAKSAKTTKTSGGGSFFLIVIVALAILYFFVLRPRSRRARQQQGGRKNLEVGDDVVTAGGIFGRVTGVIGDEIEVEVAPGYTLTFWRRAVNLRSSVAGAPPRAESEQTHEEPEPWEDSDGLYGVEHRFDDGEQGTGSTPSGHFEEAGGAYLDDDQPGGDPADGAGTADGFGDGESAGGSLANDADESGPGDARGARRTGGHGVSDEGDPGATEGS